jgi:hypothetical protein
MIEINDIDQHTLKSSKETDDDYRDTVLHFQPDWRNKKVVDLACGNGWLGEIALKQGAEFVRFADARSVNFRVPEQNNHSFELVDLDNREMLNGVLKGMDTIIYCGHFYHATNHEEILDAFQNSNCVELFFESKIFYVNKGYHEHSADILWVKEPTNDPGNAWRGTEENMLVGQPNFKWLKKNLSKRFDVKNIAIFKKKYYNEFFDITTYFHKVNFHCVKKSV